MATIILNNSLEFEFSDYIRNTYFNNDGITSEGYINNIKGNNISVQLYELSEETITSIQIKKDNEIIYTLPNINANLTNINEGYNGERVYINIALRFNI